MKPEDLGYTDKWIKYGFIDAEMLNSQITEFNRGEDTGKEHYRYRAFLGWLSSKDTFTNNEIENYIELAKEDSDIAMGGSAVKELFLSSSITDQQFEYIKSRLPEFGDWTKKLICRETLLKRLRNEVLKDDLFQSCVEYKKKFRDNLLIKGIIKITNNSKYLSEFINHQQYGKRIRNLANEKLKKINK